MAKKNSNDQQPEEEVVLTTEVDAEAPVDQQDLRILIICKNEQIFKNISQYLTKRGWTTFVKVGLGEAIQTAVREVPHFVLISVDNPHPKVMMIPMLLQQVIKTRIVMYGEDMTANSIKKLNTNKAKYVWKNTLSGPAIERGIKQIIHGEQNRDSADQENTSESTETLNEEDSVEVKGSAEKLKELMRFITEEPNGPAETDPSDGTGNFSSSNPSHVEGTSEQNNSEENISGGHKRNLQSRDSTIGENTSTSFQVNQSSSAEAKAMQHENNLYSEQNSKLNPEDQAQAEGINAANPSMQRFESEQGKSSQPHSVHQPGAQGKASTMKNSGSRLNNEGSISQQSPPHQQDKIGSIESSNLSGSSELHPPHAKNGKLLNNQTENNNSLESNIHSAEQERGSLQRNALMQPDQKDDKNKNPMQADVESEGSGKVGKGLGYEQPTKGKNGKLIQLDSMNDSQKNSNLDMQESSGVKASPKLTENDKRKKKQAGGKNQPPLEQQDQRESSQNQDEENADGEELSTNKKNKAHSEKEKVGREKLNLEKLSVEYSQGKDLWKLYESVKQAFNLSCDNKFSDMKRLTLSHKFMCFTLRSEMISGYLLVAAPSDVVDEDFILDFRSTLIQQFHEREIEYGVDVPDVIDLVPTEFIQWSDSSADFCLLNVHKNSEIGLAFFPHEKILPQSLSTHKGMAEINLHDISPGKRVDFGVYLHLVKNNKFYKYLKENRAILEKQKLRLIEKDNTVLHVKRKDISKFKRYHIESFLASEIEKFRRWLAEKVKNNKTG